MVVKLYSSAGTDGAATYPPDAPITADIFVVRVLVLCVCVCCLCLCVRVCIFGLAYVCVNESVYLLVVV
jgi:hypothetical protein